MEQVAEQVRKEAILSLQSAIRKSEKAALGMAAKGSSVTLVNKRLKAMRIGLAVLEKVWLDVPHAYTSDEMEEARIVLAGLFPSLESAWQKLKENSSQRTLLERRITALQLAAAALEEKNAD